ncbi:MAG: fumarylacetoacetate hydrolase family protein, partial [Actinomycetota bacterium]|nr:fumarylacetoacetate hydrolase family protein [Actinomycetota bacterium]
SGRYHPAPTMRLITYERGGARRLGAWVGETVVDLPEAVGHPAFPPTMEALVQHIGGSILDAAHDILDDEEIVDECAVARPRLLSPLVPSTKPIAVLTDGGIPLAPQRRSVGAGLGCIVGAARSRRMSRHEPRIFGYTLVAHWTGGKNEAPTTRVGPCVVTPEHIGDGALTLHVRIDGQPCGEKTFAAPNRVFGRLLADPSSGPPLEPGDLAAWMGWTFSGRKGGSAAMPHTVEVAAEPIGVLRAERPPK